MKYWWLYVANVALKSPIQKHRCFQAVAFFPRTASSASAEVRPSLVGPAFRGDWRLCSDLPRAPVAGMGRNMVGHGMVRVLGYRDMSPKWFLDFFQENPNLRLKTHGFRADPWKSTHAVKVCDCSANWTLFRRKGAETGRIRQGLWKPHPAQPGAFQGTKPQADQR